MKTRIFKAEGHLIDSAILSGILNSILAEGADYRIISLNVGKRPAEISSLEIEIIGKGEEHLKTIGDKLTPLGVYEQAVPSAVLEPADMDRHAPESFYSTTNHRTEVYYEGNWYEVCSQRMDAAVVYETGHKRFICRKLRDIKKNDLVVCGSDSVRVFPFAAEKKKDGFSFMSNEVSSERSDNIAIERTALELEEIRNRGGRTVVVCGPVVIHTGGAEALAEIIRNRYIHGFLGGNAAAVHDLESQFFGTSLGVDVKTGKVAEHGHNHHMRAINKIYGYGSIAAAVDAGELKAGLMYEVIRSGIPYCLAGSIRDDGPLPETVNDMIEAQRQYAEIISDADMILMLSTMLHSIGTGNMTPSWVKTICVDINPAVVTKLSDRGSSQAVGVVSDVGLFLRALRDRLQPNVL